MTAETETIAPATEVKGNPVARAKNTEALNKLGLKYIVRKGGEHLLVFVDRNTRLNFWPDTGKWSEYGDFKNIRPNGFFEHITVISEDRKDGGDRGKNDDYASIDEKDKRLLTIIAAGLRREYEEKERDVRRLKEQEQALIRAIKDLYDDEQ